MHRARDLSYYNLLRPAYHLKLSAPAGLRSDSLRPLSVYGESLSPHPSFRPGDPSCNPSRFPDPRDRIRVPSQVMMPKRKATAPPARVRTAPTEDSEASQPRRSSRQVASKQCDDDKAKTRKIQADVPKRTPSPEYNANDPHDGAGPAILYPESARFKKIIEELTADGERLKQKARRDRLKIFQDSLLSPPSPHAQNQAPGTRPQRGQSTRLAQSKTILATDVDSDHICSRESSPLSSSKSVTDAGSDFAGTAETRAPDELAEPADRGAGRSPPVHSEYLPLPWNGRLGYVCLFLSDDEWSLRR